jgi:hypothetical protein
VLSEKELEIWSSRSSQLKLGTGAQYDSHDSHLPPPTSQLNTNAPHRPPPHSKTNPQSTQETTSSSRTRSRCA